MVLLTKLQLLGAALGLFAPNVASLAAKYDIYQSKYDSEAQIRIQKHDGDAVCHGGVRSRSGWADLGHHHMFFWYYEARNAKLDTPVMLWLTGGPGGASQVSALVENGDCYFDASSGEPKRNPYGWTEEFHMIYLDQPAGVGFSYVDNNTAYPQNTEEAAPDVVWFLKMFSEAFPSIASNPLHIAGESFGGRWVPVVGDLIIRYNELAPQDEKIPLASLIVVSPWTRPGIQLPSTFDVSCFPFKYQSAYMNSSACAKMEAVYQHCETVMHACESTNDPLVCKEAGAYCMENIAGIVENQLVNKYDRRMTCAKPGECYPIMLQVQDWMNSRAVFGDMLDVVNQSGGLKTSFDFMSMRTYSDFLDSGDMFMDSSRYVSTILSNSQIPMFFTAGDSDVLVNPKGVRETLERIRWEGRPAFKNLPFEQFHSRFTSRGTNCDQAAAVMRRSDRLWYAEVSEAGHMAPYDQPQVMLMLVRNWLAHVGRKPVDALYPLENLEKDGQTVFSEEL